MDVREASELQISKLDDDDVLHLPLSQLQHWAELMTEDDNDVLDINKPVICLVRLVAVARSACVVSVKLVL